ncbi:MAG: hypothetical protein ACOZNI_21910 [Myxococcota bacterium]
MIALLAAAALAAPAVPSREIPAEVLVELQLLENRFELALAADCDPALCFAKGCTWLDHAVADRPPDRSMPGLADEPGPSAATAQPYLTRAQCSFAHEPTLDAAHAQALVRRLQTRLSGGWTVVSVEREALSALPVEEPAEAAPEEVPEATPPAPPPTPPWTDTAGRELWATLLPHFWWMIGAGLATAAATTLIWAWRRVGRATVEEQALLAELTQPEAPPAAEPPPAAEAAAGEADRAFVAEQEKAWRATLEAMDPEHPAPELQALVRERLRAGDLPLLAKAVLRFPDHFPAIFPHDGETATAKLELAELLRTVDASSLPGDVAFFTALQRHALAARLSSQPDARIVRSLREDFGAAGLAELVRQQPPRVGALLFALSPPIEQHEMARLLPAARAKELCRQLLRSNRMDPSETRAVFEVLRAARGESSATAVPPTEITDRGATFDAAGALAVLLPSLPPLDRASLFDDALDRAQGNLPAWTRAILVPEMLFALHPESRADLLLEIEAEPLAAWLSLVDAETRARLLDGVPDTLRATIQATSVFPSRERQLSLASRGRRDLARSFVRQLARARIPFERALRPDTEAEA